MALTKLPGFTLDSTSNTTFANTTVTGNLTSGNANLGNLAIANYFSGSGNLLSNIQVANVTGLGNLATVNKDGNSSNILYGNGVFASAPVTYGNSNVVTLLSSYGSNTIVTTGNITGGNIIGIIAAGSNTITTTGNANVGNLGFGSGVITGTGNITAGNANLGNAVTANYFIGNLYGTANLATYATTANAVAGANVSGFVPNANIANTAYAIAGANVSGQVGNALLAGTVYTNAQPNITSVGTLTGLNVTGDTTLTGNLTVSGAFEYANVTSFKVKDPIIEQGGNTAGGALASNDGFDRGQLLHYYVTANTTAVDAFMGWDNSNAEFAFASNVTVASEVATFNNFGNVRASYFLGNGSQLTGLSIPSGTLISSGTSNVNIASAGSNITMGVAGNANILVVTGTGVNIAGYANLGSGNLLTTGNVSAGFFLGNGSQLTGISAVSAGYIVNGTSNINIATSGGNVTVGVAGNAGIVTVTGTGVNIAGYANLGSGNLTTTGNVSAGFFLGNGSQLTGVDAAGRVVNGASNLNIATSGGNITMGVAGNAGIVTVTGTGVNIAGYANLGSGGLTTTGNANVGNLGFGSGIITGTGNITAGNANLGNLITANYSSAVLTTGAQPNITGVGLLANLTVGNATANSVFGNGTITSTGNITFSGANVSLGTVANVHITGGSIGQFLKTDGAGNLTWDTASGGGGGTALTYTAASSPPVSSNIADQWYNVTTNVLYEYVNDGTASYWVDIQTPATASYITTAYTARSYTADGTNNTYTITLGCGVNDVLVFLNGICQMPTTDYTISSTTLTLDSVPTSGVKVQIRELPR
jgi:hypothetical protein